MGQNFSTEPVVEKETERAENETFNTAVSSCQGWRMSQEDNHSLILELPQSEYKASFFAVFDGHGSARVSKHASEGLWRHLTSNPAYKKGDFKEALEQSFLSFDKEVSESYNAQLAGTTAVCVLIVDNVIYCANIGDSRAVASINCECEPLSFDHKPDKPEELKRILAAGGYVLGNRVNGNLALSRAFGDFHYKSNEQLSPEDQIVSPSPDIKRIELNDDLDFILLACDGIWDVLTSEEVVKFVISRLEQNMEPGLICEQLTTRCVATEYELVIGCDNMTVLLVCYTRGRSWPDYCTDIFNKNTKKLGVPRTRSFNPEDLEDETDFHRRRQQQRVQQQLQQQQVQQEQKELNSLFFRSPDDSDDSDDRLASSFFQGPLAPGRSDDFATHIPSDLEVLLDAIKNMNSDERSPVNETSSDQEALRITEVTNDDSSESQNQPDPTGSSSQTSVEQQKVSAHSEEDKNDDQVESSASNENFSSKTTEVQLGEPSDEVEPVGDPEQSYENENFFSKTIEIELAPSVDEQSGDSNVPDPVEDRNKFEEDNKEENSTEDGGSEDVDPSPVDGGDAGDVASDK